MVEVVPAILTNDIEELRDLLSQAEGVVDRVQIDIIDGQFVDNKTVDPSVFENIETTLLLDFHLMVKEPKSWVERCIRAGADRIIGQVEMMSDQTQFLGKVQEVGKYVGLAVDLETPISKIDSVILNNLDVVLVMSVPAGFGGQEFNDSALEKIKELDEIRARDDTPFKIIVDGGVSLENIRDLKKAGADEVSVGRRIFEGSLEENIKMFVDKAYKE